MSGRRRRPTRGVAGTALVLVAVLAVIVLVGEGVVLVAYAVSLLANRYLP